MFRLYAPGCYARNCASVLKIESQYSEVGGPVNPGWYDDPDTVSQFRYWDGSEWTEQRKPKPPGSASNSGDSRRSDKSYVTTLLLCFLLGTFGVHRFYVGKIGTGVLQLLTLGGFFIWAFIDLVVIIVGNFQDNQGLPIKSA